MKKIILFLAFVFNAYTICAQILWGDSNLIQKEVDKTEKAKQVYVANLDTLCSVVRNFQEYVMSLYEGNERNFENITKYSEVIENALEYIEKQHVFSDIGKDSVLLGLKQSYGDILFLMADKCTMSNDEYRRILLKSADYNSPEALYELGRKWDNDFFTRKMFLKRCLSLVKSESLRKKVKREYESFPDFLFISDDDEYLYCHVLSEERCEVTICGMHPKDSLGIINIPSTVVHNDKTYTVVKVSSYNSHVFFSDLPFKSRDENLNFAGNPFIRRVTFPNTVTEIGPSAFNMALGLEEIVLPNSLNVIRDSAFLDCQSLDSVYIPEGVKEIGVDSFWNCTIGDPSSFNYNSLVLPASLERLNQNSIVPGRLVNLYLSPGNKHFRLINGALYSADSSIVYNNLIPESTKVLFVPDTMQIRDVKYYPCDSLRRYEISKSHKYYSNYKGVIYTKDFSSIVSIPRDIEWIEFSPNLKSVKLGCVKNCVLGENNKIKIIISPEMNPDILYTILIDFVHQELDTSFLSSYTNKFYLYDEDRSILSLYDVMKLAEVLLDAGLLSEELVLDKGYKVNYDKSFYLYNKQLFYEKAYLNK